MDQKAKYFEPNETLASQHEIFGPTHLRTYQYSGEGHYLN